MSDFKTELMEYMIADTGITDLVASRIFSHPAPQGVTSPYVMVSRVTENPNRNLIAPNERYREIWQIDIYSETDSNAEVIKKAIRSRLDICNQVVMGTYQVLNIFLQSSDDLSDLEDDASEQRIARKMMEFTVIREKSEI